MAENFLHLSKTYNDAGRGKRTEKMFKCLRAIIELMDPDYTLDKSGPEIIEILEKKKLPTNPSNYYRYIRFIKTMVDYLQKNSQEQKEMWKELQTATKNKQECRSTLLAIKAFEKDGITNWAKVQELLHPTPAPEPKETAEETQEKKTGKGWFPLIPLEPEEKKQEPSDMPSTPEPAKPNMAVQDHEESLIEMQKINEGISALYSTILKNQEDIRQKDATISDLTSEIGNLKSDLQRKENLIAQLEQELQKIKDETPDNLVEKIREALEKSKENLALTEALAKRQKTLLPKKPMAKSPAEKINGDLPGYSDFYHKQIRYDDLAISYVKSLGKKAVRKIIRTVQILADHGHRYPSLVPDRIEGGGHNGRNKIRAGRYRILWEEKADYINIVDP